METKLDSVGHNLADKQPYETAILPAKMKFQEKRRVTEPEYYSFLKKHDLRPNEFCHLIFNLTGAVLYPKHINQDLERNGFLSHPLTALIRLSDRVLTDNHGKI